MANKSIFGEDSLYLQDNFVIDLRREIALSFLEGRRIESVLDVGCGDGRISMEFMADAKVARMVDASPYMIAAAERGINERALSHVETYCYNFENEINIIEGSTYNLIICTGVLAHVDNPERVVDKLISLASDKCLIILQNTDAIHPYTKLVNALKAILRMIGLATVKLNKVYTRDLVGQMHRAGFELIKKRSYVSAFPIIGKSLSKRSKYVINRMLSGKSGERRLQCLGNESLLLFER